MLHGSEAPLLAPILWLLLSILWVVPPEVYPLVAVAAPLLAATLGLVLLAGGWRPSSAEWWLLAAFAAPLALSHAFAADSGASVDSLTRLGGMFVVFAAARAMSGPARLGTWRLLAVAGAVLALHALWQVAFEFDRLLALPGLDPALVTRLETHRAFSRFILPSTFASFLLLALPAAAGQALQVRGRARALLAVAALLAAGGLILTQSQGAFLALLVAAGCWVVGSARRPVRIGAAGLAIAAAVVLVAVAAARGGVLFDGSGTAGPAALRWRNWSAAARMAADHPLTGVGGGGFGSAYTAYRSPGDNETRFAHNVYLQAATEHGLPVLIPVAALLLACGLSIRRAARRGRPAEAGAAFGLTAFLLHNLWDFPALLISPLWTAAAVAGLLARSSGAGERLSPAGRSRASGLRSAEAVAIGLLLAAGALVGVRAGLGRWQLEAAREAVLDEAPAQGLARARSAEWLAPWQAENPLFVAEALLAHPALAAPGEAAAAAARAVERNPAWPAARAIHARALATTGDAGGAAAELGRATILYPMAESYRRELTALGERVTARRGDDR